MKEKKKNLNIRIPADIHAELKIIAAKRYMTMSKYLLNQIMALIEVEKKYD